MEENFFPKHTAIYINSSAGEASSTTTSVPRSLCPIQGVLKLLYIIDNLEDTHMGPEYNLSKTGESIGRKEARKGGREGREGRREGGRQGREEGGRKGRKRGQRKGKRITDFPFSPTAC